MTMEKSVVFSGFGGQGLLFAGQILARAAIKDGLEVFWIPSYGPEMRGGTAACTVIVGEQPIGSPIVDQYDAAVAMNGPSLLKYGLRVHPGGLLVVNSSLVVDDRKPTEQGTEGNDADEAVVARLAREMRARDAQLLDVRPPALGFDERRVDDEQPARSDRVLELRERRGIHDDGGARPVHDRRSDRPIRDDNGAGRRAAAHLGSVRGDPERLESAGDRGLGEDRSSEEDALAAEAREDDAVLHGSALLDSRCSGLGRFRPGRRARSPG